MLSWNRTHRIRIAYTPEVVVISPPIDRIRIPMEKAALRLAYIAAGGLTLFVSVLAACAVEGRALSDDAASHR